MTPVESVQRERALGLWLFLMGDVVLFALLFGTYAVMVPATDGGPVPGPALFSLGRTAIYSALLLLSAPTFGMASVALARGARGAAMLWLLVTFGLGAAFLALELAEFRALVAQDAGPGRSGFLSAYFALVGTHGLHVAAGLVWLGVTMARLIAGTSAVALGPSVELLGAFWHLIGLVWVVIYSVVYLPALAT